MWVVTEKSDVKKDTKVFSLSNRGLPLPQKEEARGKPRLQGRGVQTDFKGMRLD